MRGSPELLSTFPRLTDSECLVLVLKKYLKIPLKYFFTQTGILRFEKQKTNL